jgi:hypothetical protein
MDVDSIALGRDFRSVLRKTLEYCDLMLVVIDKDWIEAKDKEGRIRLENPDDYVRTEVEAALKRDIRIVPVLVRGAPMPAAEQLPAEIRDLAHRNAANLSPDRWESDLQDMLRRLNIVPYEDPSKQRVSFRRLPAPRRLALIASVALALGYGAYWEFFRTEWTCNNRGKEVGAVSIWWGHRKDDATWACNDKRFAVTACLIDNDCEAEFKTFYFWPRN